MKMDAFHDEQTGTMGVTARLTDAEVSALRPGSEPRAFRELADAVQQRVINHIAEQYLQEHLQEVLAAINPVAVANLAVAKAAQQIMDRLTAPINHRDHVPPAEQFRR